MKTIFIILSIFNLIFTSINSSYIPFHILNSVKDLSKIANINEPKIIVKKHKFNSRKYLASINGTQKKSFLVFGLGLIRTASMITKHNEQIMRGIIAHEIGHIVSKRTESSISNEYNADLMALTLLGEDGDFCLTSGICLAHLATELFQVWNNIRFENKRLCHKMDFQYVIEYVTSKIIKKFPSLGNLGKVSDKYFSNTIVKIIIDNLQVYEDTQDIYVFSKKIYSEIKKECLTAPQITEKDRKECLDFELKVWNGSKITHPELFLRIEKIQKN